VPAAGDGVPKQSDEGALEDRTQELVGVAQQVAWLVIKWVARGVQLFYLASTNFRWAGFRPSTICKGNKESNH